MSLTLALVMLALCTAALLRVARLQGLQSLTLSSMHLSRAFCLADDAHVAVPGARALLPLLTHLSVSDVSLPPALLYLDQAGWDTMLAGGPLPGLIDLLVCGDTLAKKKPDAAPILYALEKFGTAASRTLMVGDSSIDVACARNAGVPVWMVPYGYNGGHPAESAGADRVIPTLTEVALACSGTVSASVNLADRLRSAPIAP